MSWLKVVKGDCRTAARRPSVSLVSNPDSAFRFVCQNLFIFYLSGFIVAVIFIPLYFIISFASDVCSVVDEFSVILEVNTC